MNKVTNILLGILLVVVLAFGAYYTINEISTEDPSTATIINTKVEEEEMTVIDDETEYKTVFFKDENHAIYMDVPKDWNIRNADYEIRERSPMISLDSDKLNEYGAPIGNAMIAYYDAGGSTLEEWAQLHFVNDIKGEFGEDFVMKSFSSEFEKGIEIIGTNRLHPLWPPKSDRITHFTYYYFLNNDKTYEFELRLPEKYLSNYEKELEIIKDSVYFGEPFNLDEWEIYTNEDSGFSVKYPSVWNASENWEQIGGFVGFDEKEDLFEGHSVTISTLSEEGYTNSLAGQTRLENTQLSYPRIDGVPAVRISGDYPEPTYGFSDYSDSVFFMNNGLRIKMAYQEIGFDLESRELFSQMIRTFEFIK